MKLDYPEGATPLDSDAIAGLIPNLTTQAELNAFEARNILEAQSRAKKISRGFSVSSKRER